MDRSIDDLAKILFEGVKFQGFTLRTVAGYLQRREDRRAAEAASPAAGWRDIATAERKPDNVIWAAHPGFKPFLAQWTVDFDARGACWLSVEGGCDYKPTLWMPVVEPPRPAPSEEARAG